MSEFEKPTWIRRWKQRNFKIFGLFPRNALSRRPGAAYNAAGDFTVYITETIFITTEFIEEILCVIIPAPPITWYVFKLSQSAPQNCLNGQRPPIYLPCKFLVLEFWHGRDDIQMSIYGAGASCRSACMQGGVWANVYHMFRRVHEVMHGMLGRQKCF